MFVKKIQNILGGQRKIFKKQITPIKHIVCWSNARPVAQRWRWRLFPPQNPISPLQLCPHETMWDQGQPLVLLSVELFWIFQSCEILHTINSNCPGDECWLGKSKNWAKDCNQQLMIPCSIPACRRSCTRVLKKASICSRLFSLSC